MSVPDATVSGLCTRWSTYCSITRASSGSTSPQSVVGRSAALRVRDIYGVMNFAMVVRAWTSASAASNGVPDASLSA